MATNTNSTTSKPLKDPGVDSGKITRNITRTELTGQSTLNPSRRVLGWDYIVRVLTNTTTTTTTTKATNVYSGNNSSSRIDVINSIMFMSNEEGVSVPCYCYTNGDGVYVRKNVSRTLTIPSILQTLTSLSSTTPLATGQPSQISVVSYAESETMPTMHTSLEMITAAKEAGRNQPVPSLNTVLICVFLAPKYYVEDDSLFDGTSTSSSASRRRQYGNYRHEYKLSKHFKPIERHLHLSTSTHPSQPPTVSVLQSTNKPVNVKMTNAVKTIVSCIERKVRCRVVEISVEFLVDCNGGCWVVRVLECVVQEEGFVNTVVGGGRERDRTQVKVDERRRRRGVQDDASSLSAAYSPSPTITIPQSNAYGGSSSTKRSSSTRNTDPVSTSTSALASVSDAWSAGSPVRYARGGRRAGTPQGIQSPGVLNTDAEGEVDLLLSDFSPAPSPAYERSSSCLSLKARPRAEQIAMQHSSSAAVLLGSSQTEGNHLCRGDFCNVDISSFAKVKKGLQNDNDHAISNSSSSVDNKDSGVSELRIKLLELEREDAEVMLGQLKREKHSRNNQEKASGDVADYELPMKVIIQARKEKSLVDLYIRRHAQNSSNLDSSVINYQNSMIEDDLNLGDVFPGVYYRDVKVCKCCFDMYRFIEEGRSSSLARLRRKKGGAKKKSGGGKRKKENLAIADYSSQGDDGDSDDTACTQMKGSSNPLDADGSKMLQRCQIALESITKKDVSELRAFTKPPPAVKMIGTCLTIILKNSASSDWTNGIKPLIANGDKFYSEILNFDPSEDLNDKQYKHLDPYLRNPNFNPYDVSKVSEVGAKFCAWIIGVVNCYNLGRGFGHGRLDVLASDKWFNSRNPVSILIPVHSSEEEEVAVGNGDGDLLSPDSMRGEGYGAIAPMPMPMSMPIPINLNPTQKPELPPRTWNDYEKDMMKRKKTKLKFSSKAAVQASTKVGFGRGGDGVVAHEMSTSRQLFDYGSDSDSSLEGGIIKSSSTSNTSAPTNPHMKRAKIAAQRRRMAELAQDGGGTGSGSTHERKALLCADSVTRMPYEVLGQSEMEISRVNFVVVHDIFDTVDMTKMLFIALTKKHPGCQILLMNYPGQANTTFPNAHSPSFPGQDSAEPALNNDFISKRIDELIRHVDDTGEFVSSAQPFHLLGIGNGVPIALSFADTFGSDEFYRSTLRSIVSINGFANVDSQLASVLHSSLNVFKAFPTNRPDLPVSYFTRFLFSDEYLEMVPRNLALNIYTAVTNQISLEGRIRLCAGALKHKDSREIAKRLKLPLIAMQSTENVFVNASNVDSLLEGRSASHIWSHELKMDLPEDKNCYNRKSLESLMGALNRKGGALVVFIRAGHALQQEARRSVTDMLDILACPTPEYTGVDVPQFVDFATLKPGPDLLTSTRKVMNRQLAGSAIPDEEKKSESRADDDKNGDFLDDSNDAEFLESEVMRLAEGNDDESGEASQEELAPPEPAASYFDSLQKELMTQIRSEHERMVHDAGLVEAEDKFLGNFKEASAYTVKGAPSGNFSSLQDTEDEIEREREVEANRKRDEMRAHAAAQPVKSKISAPSIPSKVASASVESNANAKAPTPSSIKPPSSTEASTRFYMQDVRGGEKQMGEPTRAPLAGSSYEPAEDIYAPGGSRFVETRPAQGDVARPTNTIPSNIPGSNTAKKDENATTQGFDNFSLPQAALDMLARGVPLDLIPPELLVASATDDQKSWRTWSDDPLNRADPKQPPSANETLRLDAELNNAYEKERMDREKKRLKEEADIKLQMEEIQRKQEQRRKEYEAEDAVRLAKLEGDNFKRQAERAQQDMQRKLEIQKTEERLIKNNLVEKYVPPSGTSERIPVMAPVFYDEHAPLPSMFTDKKPDLDNILDRLESDSDAARKMGIMRLDDFDKVKTQMATAQLERDSQLRNLEESDQLKLFNEMAMRIQTAFRGLNGRRGFKLLKKTFEANKMKKVASIKLQALGRGFISRLRVRKLRSQEIMELVLGSSANSIQRLWRGYKGREEYKMKLCTNSCLYLQRVFRGFIGRMAANAERAKLNDMKARAFAAIKIQSTWKMMVAREEYRFMRVHQLASVEIQRVFRGRVGRKRALRISKWENTEPGPARLKMGLELINESKLAFERQQEEIDALHRSQGKAEARVSHIHEELKESEKELLVLERELQDIDQIETDLQELTHERQLRQMNIEGAVGVSRAGDAAFYDNGGGGAGNSSMVDSKSATLFKNPQLRELAKKSQQETHALEMAIHLKRAEREKKKNEIESEFTLVFSEVERKKAALERLEIAIGDMEATRTRKDREFGRLQRNLMELLQEQKYELDALREKGIELETATATSAAAAAATAHKAKEHEKQTSVMFNQQEELMKFQFMSMSLSYFSSLNMLKQMRDINTDTTASAISSSADTAAAAAAAAAAANLPAIKQMKLGATDAIDASISIKEAELRHQKKTQEDSKISKNEPFPPEVRLWSVKDVGRWLQTLALGMYVGAFDEACVDGEFLLELREEDMQGVLNITHKLHRRKLMLAREKLTPLTLTEIDQRRSVIAEESAQNDRDGTPVPDLLTVFSQVRNGRTKRLEESLRLGFAVNDEDEKGNTILLIAVQNNQRKMLDMILNRGGNINHTNASGNTALHFALAFVGSDGDTIAEFLIEKGADDTIENKEGLSPYDGLGTTG